MLQIKTDYFYHTNQYSYVRQLESHGPVPNATQFQLPFYDEPRILNFDQEQPGKPANLSTRYQQHADAASKALRQRTGPWSRGPRQNIFE